MADRQSVKLKKWRFATTPARSTASVPPVQPFGCLARGHLMRVLVIDDNESARATTALLLQGQATGAADCATGLALARTGAFDVIVVEAYFARSHRRAVEWLPMLRAACPGAALVVLTLDWDAAEADRAIDLGALAYVEKWPLQLRRIVDACVETAREGRGVSVRAVTS